MENLIEIYEFAIKWKKKFEDKKSGIRVLLNEEFLEDFDYLIAINSDDELINDRYEEVYGGLSNVKKALNEIDDFYSLMWIIYSYWTYFAFDKRKRKEIIKKDNRDWFILTLSKLASLALEYEAKPLFEGKICKIQLISKVGSEYKGSNIREILKIDKSKICFIANNYGHDVREEIIEVDSDEVNKLFLIFESIFKEERDETYLDSINYWLLKLTNEEGKEFKYHGYLEESLVFDNKDLSDYLRQISKKDDLLAFDMNRADDLINSLEIEYLYSKRTKVIGDESVLKGVIEKIAIIRDEGIFRHEIIGAINTVHLYRDRQGVEKLLDDLNSGGLFYDIKGNPDDVIEDLDINRYYQIIIDYDKKGKRIIKGTFDKLALPIDYEEFADKLYSFISSREFNDIYNPIIYGRTKRRKDDYIVISVIFERKAEKSYYYLSDSDDIEVGDLVIVQVGEMRSENIAKVVNIEYFTEEDIPYNLDLIKKIIRKCNDEDINKFYKQYRNL